MARKTPPLYIAIRVAQSNRLRNEVYGHEVPHPMAERSLWSWIFTDFIGSRLFSLPELWALPARYVAEFGATEYLGGPHDEVVRRKFKNWLYAIAKRENRRQRAKELERAWEDSGQIDLRRARAEIAALTAEPGVPRKPGAPRGSRRPTPEQARAAYRRRRDRDPEAMRAYWRAAFRKRYAREKKEAAEKRAVATA